MAANPKKFFRSDLPTVEASQTVPVAKRWIITNVVLVNTGASNADATIKLDGSPLVYSYTLAPKEIFTLDCAQVVEQSGTLAYSATAAGVKAHISGAEQDVVG